MIEVDLARDGLAVHRLGPVDGVAAGDHPTAGRSHRGTAIEHLAEQLERQLVAGPGHQVQREQRSAAHGVHVAGRVGGGDATPGTGVVDDGGEEVGGRHQGASVGTAPHGSVVAGVDPDDEVAGSARVVDVAQNLRQVTGTELAGSTGAVAVLRQP